MSTAELVQTLAHPNGWHRDTASRLLFERQDRSAAPLLEKLITETKEPLAKLHAMSALDGLAALREDSILTALADGDPFVRERGVALAEKLIVAKFADPKAFSERLPAKLAEMAGDPDARVRFQLAFTIQSTLQKVWLLNSDPRQITAKLALAIAKLAVSGHADRWQSAAVLSGPPDIVTGLLFQPMTQDPALEINAAPFIAKLIEMRAASKTDGGLAALIDFIAKRDPNPLWIRALGDGLRRAGSTIEKADGEHRLSKVFAKAAGTATDAKAPPANRLAAIGLLELTSLKESSGPLTRCLEESGSDAVQSAALKTLAQHSGPEITKTLLDHWPKYGAKVKDAALGVFVAREDRTIALLTAVQSGAIKPADLSASQVQVLVHHKDAKIAALAKTALASVIPPSREEVAAKYKPALAAKGDAAKGREIYAQRCIACHRFGDQGFQLGPDLITVKTKGREGILAAILDPNKEVAPQFIAYTVNTKDGQSLMGFIAKDDASGMTLKMIGGVEQTIQRGQIKGSSSSGQSLMPEGIETGLDVQGMADLLTFIEELK